ncbi:MAG: hypothetical protein AB1806_00620 [Acidobacteriota bacterium]
MIRPRPHLSAHALPTIAVATMLMSVVPCGVAAQVDAEVRLTQELDQLKARVEQRYRVAVTRDGLVLVPRAESSSVGSVEVTADLVLIDGTPVTGGELRERLPRDAAAISRLSLLDARVQRALFAPEPPRPSTPQAEPERPAAPPLPERPDDWVERDRYARGGARVRIGGDIWVKEDEWIGDAVVAVLGSARVDGRVDGDVVAVGGGVQLGPKAVVRGEVVSVGGGVERAPGARVGGQTSEVRIGFPTFSPRIRLRPWQDWSWFGTSLGGATDLIATLSRMGILALLVIGLATIVPLQVRRIGDQVAAEPWRAGFVGLAAQLLFVPVLVITVLVLAVSIIGIPLLLLVPFAALAFLFAFLLGFAGTASAVGQAVSRRFGGRPLPLVVGAAVGLAVIWALTAIARFAGLAGLPARVILSVVLVAGFVIEYVAWTVGLGGVLVSRFGRRDVAGMPTVLQPPPVSSSDVI